MARNNSYNDRITNLGKTAALLLSAAIVIVCGCSSSGGDKGETFDRSKEAEAVEVTLNNVFGWAIDKDFDLFFKTIADDSAFISVTPYDRVKFGVGDVKSDTSFWGSPHFKAISHEIRDLRIHFSGSGDVAWFYCVVNDFNEWNGMSANWENVRWTGVLEKRNGAWVVVQQHFSYPKLGNQ